MQDRYALSRSRRLVIRAIALIFFLLAVEELAETSLPLVAPHLIAPGWSAEEGLVGAPDQLLPEMPRFQLATRPGARARFLTRLNDPATRWRHFALTIAISGLVVVILGGMGMALWRSTRLVPRAVESGMTWLIAVGWACAMFAVAFPVADGFRSGLLLQGVLPGAPSFWYDPDTSGTTYILLLIAAGILAATWTIEAGLRARADLAEIV